VTAASQLRASCVDRNWHGDRGEQLPVYPCAACSDAHRADEREHNDRELLRWGRGSRTRRRDRDSRDWLAATSRRPACRTGGQDRRARSRARPESRCFRLADAARIAKALAREAQRRTGTSMIAPKLRVRSGARGGGRADQQVRRGVPRRRYYGGCEIVDVVEDLAIARARSYSARSTSTCSPTRAPGQYGVTSRS